MKCRGFECETCAAHRLHRIVAVHETRSKKSRLYRVRECTACGTRTPLSFQEQSSVCPKCLEIRCPAINSYPEFRRRKVIDGHLEIILDIPVRRRRRRCRNCKFAFSTYELSAANFC